MYENCYASVLNSQLESCISIRWRFLVKLLKLYLMDILSIYHGSKKKKRKRKSLTETLNVAWLLTKQLFAKLFINLFTFRLWNFHMEQALNIYSLNSGNERKTLFFHNLHFEKKKQKFCENEKKKLKRIMIVMHSTV